MHRSMQLIVLVLGIFVFFSSVALAEKRVALVIGNSKYTIAPPLTNPTNDANAIAAALIKLDFDVVKGIDLDERQSLKVFNKFRRKVMTADVALFFYAGHGLQVGGANYLIPTDASLESELDLQAQAMRLDIILNMMEHPDRTSIVLLDACRDNPLARQLSRTMGTRSNSVGRGLARVESGLGTYIGFSTEPGNVALDGDGEHSPFAQALLNNIDRKNLDIESIMRLVRAEVYEKTNGNQVPWGNSSLIGDGFTFNKTDAPKQEVKVAALEPTALLVPPPTNRNLATEISYWDTIKSLKNKQYFQSYIDNFPDGLYVSLANLMIVELDKISAVRQIVIEKPTEVKKKPEPEAKPIVDKKPEKPLEKEFIIAKLEAVKEPINTPVEVKLIVTKDTIRSIQKELNRIGCSVGRADGIWGRGSRKALRLYGDHVKIQFASLKPTHKILNELKLKAAGICPINCRSGFEVKNGSCARIIQETAPKKPVVKQAKRQAPPQKTIRKKPKQKKIVVLPRRNKPKAKSASGKYRYKCYSYSGNIDIFLLTPAQSYRMGQQDYDTCKRI